jgi:putative transposase
MAGRRWPKDQPIPSLTLPRNTLPSSCPRARRQKIQHHSIRHRQPNRRHYRHPERQDYGKGGPRGYDAAKKVKGRKRHVAVDSQGLLLGVIVHAANVQDADSTWDLLKTIKQLYCWLKVVFADSIYNRLAVLLACFLLGLTLIIVRRMAGTTGFLVIPRRWIVERTLGWLGRWRRLSKDYEELPEVSEAMVTLAMIRLMLHRLVHPNRKRLPIS